MVGRRLIYLHEFLELANSTKPLLSSASWLGLGARQGPWKKGTKTPRNLHPPREKREQKLQSLSRVHHGNWSIIAPLGEQGWLWVKAACRGLQLTCTSPAPVNGFISHRVPRCSGAANATRGAVRGWRSFTSWAAGQGDRVAAWWQARGGFNTGWDVFQIL